MQKRAPRFVWIGGKNHALLYVRLTNTFYGRKYCSIKSEFEEAKINHENTTKARSFVLDSGTAV